MNSQPTERMIDTPEPQPDESADVPATPSIEELKAMVAAEHARRGITTRSWFYMHVLAPIRRSHWIFRLGDFAQFRLSSQDRMIARINTLSAVVLEMQTNHKIMATALKEARDRLAHHEKAALKHSRQQLDEQREVGVLKTTTQAPRPRHPRRV